MKSLAQRRKAAKGADPMFLAFFAPLRLCARLFFVLLAAALCAFPQDDLLTRAQKALEAKDYPQAATLLRDYSEKHPEDYRALFNLAHTYTMLGDRLQAAETYTKTLAARPDLFQARLNLGMLLLEDGRASDALPHLAAAVAAQPQHFRASLLYADALARSGDRAAAVEQYGKALALDPHSAEARLGLARVHELSGRTDKAVEIYTDYLKQDPGSAPVRRRLGALYLEQKKFQEAAAELEQAARLAPAPEDDWNLARAYAGLRRPEDALPRLERLRQSQAADFDVLLLLGQMLVVKKDFPAAQEALQAAIRLRPDVPDPYVDLANVMYLQSRYPETLAVLDRVARLGPETPWFHWLRAITLDKLEQVETALESYRRFLAMDAGKYPDQEFQARQRIKALKLRLEKGGRRRKK